MKMKCYFFAVLYMVVWVGKLSKAVTSPGDSLNAYIASTHKRVFDEFNVAIFGDLSVAKAAFRGAVAVQGRASLADFDIGGDLTCSSDSRTIVVGRTLSARVGAIHGGFVVAGRGSSLHHTVRLSCGTRMDRYDVLRNGDLDFNTVRTSLLRETADFCVGGSISDNVHVENETMTFRAGERGFSCYTTFRITVADMRLITKWRYESDDFYRNIVISVVGSRAEFRNFQMIGFNPRRTLVVFCSIYGSFDLYNSNFQASMLAPTSTFTAMETVINGSIISGGLRGSLATLNIPYLVC